LRVTAVLSDGSTRDVTRLTLFESNEPAVAEVGVGGVIETQSRGGLLAVMVRYGDKFGVFHGTVPFHPPTSPEIAGGGDEEKRPTRRERTPCPRTWGCE
jgi:hypothetical protein